MLRIGNKKKGFTPPFLQRRKLEMKERAGLTLVEAMLTVFILSIGIIGVLKAYTTSLGALNVSQDTIETICLLKEKMSEVEESVIRDGGLLPQFSEGRFVGGNTNFRWSLDVTALDNEELNEIRVTVFNERRKPPRKFIVVSYEENKR